MNEPDYSSYSTKDLESVGKNIDRDRYPERYEQASSELERRRSGEYQPPESSTPEADLAEAKRANRIFWALLVLLIGIGVVTVGLSSAKRSQEAQIAMEKSQRGAKPVQAALDEAYAEETLHARLDRSGGRLMISLTATNFDLGDASEEEIAEQLALVAFQAFAKPRQLDGVKVVFATETKKFMSSETETGDTHELSSDDLRALLE